MFLDIMTEMTKYFSVISKTFLSVTEKKTASQYHFLERNGYMVSVSRFVSG